MVFNYFLLIFLFIFCECNVNLESQNLNFKLVQNDSVIDCFDYKLDENKCEVDYCNKNYLDDFLKKYWKNLEIS